VYGFGRETDQAWELDAGGKAERAALCRDYVELTSEQRMTQVFELSRFMSRVAEAGRRQRGA
jgi:hypothetical protein